MAAKTLSRQQHQKRVKAALIEPKLSQVVVAAHFNTSLTDTATLPRLLLVALSFDCDIATFSLSLSCFGALFNVHCSMSALKSKHRPKSEHGHTNMRLGPELKATDKSRLHSQELVTRSYWQLSRDHSLLCPLSTTPLPLDDVA